MKPGTFYWFAVKVCSSGVFKLGNAYKVIKGFSKVQFLSTVPLAMSRVCLGLWVSVG